VFGCGTDEIFALLNQVYLEPGDNIIQGQYGFGAFAIGARANMGEVRYAPEPHLRIDVDAVLACVDARTRLVFIANPANRRAPGSAATRSRACMPACRRGCCWC